MAGIIYSPELTNALRANPRMMEIIRAEAKIRRRKAHLKGGYLRALNRALYGHREGTELQLFYEQFALAHNLPLEKGRRALLLASVQQLITEVRREAQ